MKTLIKILVCCSILQLTLFTNTYCQQKIVYQTGFEDIVNEPYMLRDDVNLPLDGWLTNDRSVQGGLNTWDCNYYVGWLLRNVWTIMDNSQQFANNYKPISGRYSLAMCMLFGDQGNAYYSMYEDLWCSYELWGAFDYWSEYLRVPTDRWAYRTISTVGYKSLSLAFDWRCNTNYDPNYGMVGYTLDGGNNYTWLTTGGDNNDGLYWQSPYVKHTVLTLPAECENNPNFTLAFRFVCVPNGPADNQTGPAFTIDNIVLSANSVDFQCDIPKTYTAAIGNPANGLSHNIRLNWGAVTDAQGYVVDKSLTGYDGWSNIYEGKATTLNYNTGDNPNVHYFFRIQAYQDVTYCDYVFPDRYTACDTPNLKVINPADVSLDLHFDAETPIANPAITDYAIFCRTAGKWVQSNGSLGLTKIFQTKAKWGTIKITGLTAMTNYCFYAIARNKELDERSSNGFCASTTSTPFICSVPGNPAIKIGNPANGLQHHLNLSWNEVTGADGYEIQDSLPGISGWNSLGKTKILTFDHNCGDVPNKQFYYRIRAYKGNTNCNFTAPLKLFTACDIPNVSTSAVTSATIELLLNPEIPVANPAITLYSIKCIYTITNVTYTKFVQANGTLGDIEVSRKMSDWTNKIVVNGLLSNGQTYCFIGNAKNQDGDIRRSIQVCASTIGCVAISKISINPSHYICSGLSDTLKVTVDGSVPINYSWKKNNVLIPGQTDKTSISTIIPLVINPVVQADSGIYRCIIYNQCSIKDSSIDTKLSVRKSLSISKDISDQTICTDKKLQLTVQANGTIPITYTWKKDGTTITNGTNSVLTIKAIISQDSGRYYCEISNICGLKSSSTAKLTVNQSVKLISEPSKLVTICQGSKTSFTVKVTGDAPITYQWLKNDTVISKATNSTYSFTANSSYSGSFINCKISNLCNDTASSGSMILINDSVHIIKQLGTLASNCAGDNYNFSVTASGTMPLKYQWYFNGDSIFGATNSSYLLPNLTIFDNGYYHCEIKNLCGSKNTKGTFLINKEPATVVIDPLSNGLCIGDKDTLNIKNKGADPVSFQWYKDKIKINSATSNRYIINNFNNLDTGNYTCVVKNMCGTDTSKSGKISLINKISIQQDIENKSVCLGDNHSLSVISAGTDIKYQWKQNGADISNATNSIYDINSFSGANTGDFYCALTNKCGTTTSKTATLTLKKPPLIMPRSLSNKKCQGDTANFYVSVSDTNNLHFQWKKGNTIINGATNSFYTVDTVKTDDAYKCIAFNECGKDSIYATISAKPQIKIIQQPSSKSVCNGQNVNLFIIATGNPTYQWKKGSFFINGATSSSYTINPVTSNEAGDYYCILTNDCGQFLSDKTTIAVNDVLLTSKLSPLKDTSLCSGNKYSFSVLVDKPASVLYQWKLNNSTISGATNSVFSINSVQVTDGGTYFCITYNACNSLTSNQSTLTIKQTAKVITQPKSQSVCAGASNVILDLSTSGNPTYQWMKDGKYLVGKTNAYYQIQTVSKAYEGSYICIVNNSCGSDTSKIARITVNDPASIKTDIQSQNGCEGNSIQFILEATDTSGVSYQWQKNGNILTNETKNIFKLDYAKLSDAGLYKCILTNGCGSVTSATAALNINKTFTIVDKSDNINVCQGSSSSFYITVQGEGTINYQWKKDDAPINNATLSSYKFTNIRKQDEGFYSCTVSNLCSNITENFLLYTKSGPQIGLEPLVQNMCIGDSINYNISPTGTAPFTFQWTKDGINIQNQTNNYYIIDSLLLSDAGQYVCKVTNECSNLLATVSTLAVKSCDLFSVDGTITYDNGINAAISNCTVYLKSFEKNTIDSISNNLSGYYQFNNIINGKYQISVKTTHEWGGADPLDALLINRYYINIHAFADSLKEAASDVDTNYSTDPLDALFINRRYIGFIESFKKGDWIFETDEIIVNGKDVTKDIKGICVGDVDGSFLTLKKKKFFIK